MRDILNQDTVEHIVNATVPGNEFEDALFNLDTITMIEDAKTISGDGLYQIIQEAKEKGITVACLMDKLPNARTQVVLIPGPGVVEQAPRSGRKKYV